VRGNGYLRRGTRIRDERFESVRGECEIWKVYIYRHDIYIEVDTQSFSLDVDYGCYRV